MSSYNNGIASGASQHQAPPEWVIDLVGHAVKILQKNYVDSYSRADEMLRQALKLLVDKQDPYKATIYKCQGKLYRLSGQFDRAERVLLSGLRIAETGFGVIAPQTAYLRRKLCKVFTARQKANRWGAESASKQAQEFFQGEIDRIGNCVDSKYVDGAVAMLQVELAAYYTSRQCRLEQAEELYSQAAAVLQTYLDDDDMEFAAYAAISLANIYIYKDQPDQAKARECFSTAIELLGETHELTASLTARMQDCNR